jgi:hypothetical protein
VLKQNQGSRPTNFGSFAHFFQIGGNEPTPELGIVPIIDNDVTIEVPMLSAVGTPGAPMFVNTQGAGKGSIEAMSISTFLATLNMPAAGAIVGSLEKGVSPFTVHYNMRQQFYINACDIHVVIDVDKVFDQFSGALSAGGFLGIDSVSLSANYQSCITSGAIKTIIKMAGAEVPDDLKKMIDTQIQDMQTRAFNLVKSEIFDWQPTPEPPATANRGLFSSIFGGASVSLKSNYQKRGIHLTQDFQIDTSVAKTDTVSGDLNDLLPAIRANPAKYIAIVDIGEHFKKIQVAAVTNVNWGEKLPDGSDLGDPIESVQVQASYPDFGEAQAGRLTLRTLANGFHYTVGHKDPKGPGELALWTKDNPNDIINIAFLRLEKSLPQWDSDQVKVTKTIVFKSMDPRVDLSGNQTTFAKETVGKDHAPKITPDEVGYVYVKFMLDRRLPADNISITLTCSIGSRKDSIAITKANQSNIIWEIFSDKFIKETSAKIDVRVDVSGPNFTDDPVSYSSKAPIELALPEGRLKYVSPFKIPLPSVPADQVATVNGFVKAAMAPPA